MNSIKLKLIIIYVAVVLIIMIVSGTFMVYSVRDTEIDRTFTRLYDFAESLENRIVRVHDPLEFSREDLWELMDVYDIQGMILSDVGRPLAPMEFVRLFSNQSLTDGAILAAVGGAEGFDSRSQAIDINQAMHRWLSYARPVTIGDSTFIVYTRVSAEPLHDRISRTIFSQVITMLISVVLTFVLWFFLANRITNPIIMRTNNNRLLTTAWDC